MSQALYERYKEALRRGHVAALRGRLDVAEAAYLEAATIAPDRALPYTSLGGVFRRQDRFAEALAAYGAALARGAEDEGALRGRADLYADAGRRSDAAADYEALAAIVERAGRLTDACDAARRALELAESRSRRQVVKRLAALLRERGEDRPAVDALDRALHILGDLELPSPGPDRATDASGVDSPEESSSSEPDLAPFDPEDAEQGTEPSDDPALLRAASDALLDSGDLAGAAAGFLALAALHRGGGRLDAAMDACLALLAVAPADQRLQLEIAAIQVERGWRGPAAAKVRLLARLADLDGDAEALAGVAAFAAATGLEPTERAATDA